MVDNFQRHSLICKLYINLYSTSINDHENAPRTSPVLCALKISIKRMGGDIKEDRLSQFLLKYLFLYELLSWLIDHFCFLSLITCLLYCPTLGDEKTLHDKEDFNCRGANGILFYRPSRIIQLFHVEQFWLSWNEFVEMTCMRYLSILLQLVIVLFLNSQISAIEAIFSSELSIVALF